MRDNFAKDKLFKWEIKNLITVWINKDSRMKLINIFIVNNLCECRDALDFQ